MASPILRLAIGDGLFFSSSVTPYVVPPSPLGKALDSGICLQRCCSFTNGYRLLRGQSRTPVPTVFQIIFVPRSFCLQSITDCFRRKNTKIYKKL